MAEEKAENHQEEMSRGKVVYTATIENLVFELREEPIGSYRWYWPDGKRTELWHFSPDEAIGMFVARGPGLIAQSR